MAGFSVVRAYCGHGIGELFHCAPNVPHYASTFPPHHSFNLLTVAVDNKAVGVFKPGMVFTIEPMINMGGCVAVCWVSDGVWQGDGEMTPGRTTGPL